MPPAAPHYYSTCVTLVAGLAVSLLCYGKSVPVVSTKAPRLHIVSALLCRYIPSNCMLKQQSFACKKCSGNRNVHRRSPLHEHVFSREQRYPVTQRRTCNAVKPRAQRKGQTIKQNVAQKFLTLALDLLLLEGAKWRGNIKTQVAIFPVLHRTSVSSDRKLKHPNKKHRAQTSPHLCVVLNLTVPSMSASPSHW
jgi:hypothetical protein